MPLPLHRLFAVLLVLLAPAAIAAPVALVNPGFEEGASGWTITEPSAPMSRTDAKAAHQGKLGLHIEDSDTTYGSNVDSTSFTVVPGRTYRVGFWARSTASTAGCGVYLWFRDEAGKHVPGPPACAIPGDAPEWTHYEFDTVIPAGITSATVWVHSFSKNTGVWDIDDITVEELDATGGATPPAAATPVTAAPVAAAPSKPALDLTKLPPLPNPPIPVVLKVDDLVTAHGNIPARWKRITDFALERKFKLSVGIICDSLEGDSPAYFAYIKDLKKTGLFEFWFHGYDHKQWTENGKTLQEFKGSSYELQKDHFVKSQALAKEKLGFAFTTFGSPFNATDATTSRVLAEDPDIKIFLYGNSNDKASGKLLLDRVGNVNIEAPLFIPNADKFISGYITSAKGRRYYVIQGHPNQWDDARWAEFVKLIDFLQNNRIPIVTPTELAATLGSSKS